MKPTAPEYPPPGYFLRIKNWDEFFERAQTRKIPSPLSWIALPTKHDGCKFRKLIRTKRGITTFGSFCLLLEVAAKMPKRGDFVRHDLSTLTCSDFEAITGADRRTFKAAIETLLLPEFGWLELVACSQSPTIAIPSRSDMREEKRREREEPRPPGVTQEVVEAFAEACCWDIRGLTEKQASAISLASCDFVALYPKALPSEIVEFGMWHFETYWPGKRPVPSWVTEKWKQFQEWKRTSRNGESEYPPASRGTVEEQAQIIAGYLRNGRPESDFPDYVIAKIDALGLDRKPREPKRKEPGGPIGPDGGASSVH